MAEPKHAHLEQTVDTPDGKLQTSTGGPADGLLLVINQLLLASDGSLGSLSGQPLSSLSRHGC